MEILNYLKENLHIDIIIVLLVFAAGYFQQLYMKGTKLTAAQKTLLVSFVFSLLYIIALSYAGQFQKENVPMYLISYAVATSFYEILIKPFTAILKKTFGSIQSRN